MTKKRTGSDGFGGDETRSKDNSAAFKAKKLASTIAKQAPIAVRNCKKAINDGLQTDMDEAIVIEEKIFGSCFTTADQIEGMKAFLEKRKVERFINK